MGEIIKTGFLVVGSGANGISPCVYLKKKGIEDFRLITKDSDFGGVWHVNHYPGCITDIPAYVYQLSYAKSYDWSSSHPPAEEMADYLRGVAAQYGLYDHADFNTELLMAEWLNDELCWQVTTNDVIYHAKFLIVSTGYLERLKYPDLKGKDDFQGRIFHAAEWPEGYTGEGDRIAVLGTSASGVQIVPEMQKVASEVYVFQRTPSHLLPLNREVYTPEEIEEHRAKPEILDEERENGLKLFEQAAYEGLHSYEMPDQIAERLAVVNAHRETQVADIELREKLTPKYSLGCKRPTRTDLYYGSLQHSNVHFVDEGAAGLSAHSIYTASGREYEVDTVVMATGYHWGGDILKRIKRRDGETVDEYQKGHRRAYKSVSTSGCPNLFLIGGAGANGAVWHGYAAGEIMSNYMCLVLDYMKDNGIEALEVNEEDEIEWKKSADGVLSNAPIILGGCANYFLDESGHDMANWPGTMEDMTITMKEFEPKHYRVVAKREKAGV